MARKAPGVFVTGDKELDRKLRAMPAKLQKKHMRKATRKAMRKVQAEYRGQAPVETGAMEKVPTVLSITSKKVGGSRGQVGHALHIDRKKLVLERAARGGKIGMDSKRGEPFFYAVVQEFDASGPKPFRSSLYDNAMATRRGVVVELKRLIREAART